jgi:hypothetical protein
MQTTAAGLVPEDVFVLETAGTVDDFFKAAAKIDGFEFLSEYDEVPWFRFARREGLRVVLDVMGHGVKRELRAHADVVL